MRSHPELFRLTFNLPLGAAAPGGFHQPSPEGCLLDIQGQLVEVLGPSRKAVFDHAARLLRVTCKGLPPTSITAILLTPARPSGRDSWSIIIGADVAFSPTSIDTEFPAPAPERPPPALRLVEA